MKYIEILVVLLLKITLIRNIAIKYDNNHSYKSSCSEEICTSKACISTGRVNFLILIN
jgi:hypothetical protein